MRAGEDRPQAGDGPRSDFRTDDPEKRSLLSDGRRRAPQSDHYFDGLFVFAQLDRLHFPDGDTAILQRRFPRFQSISISESDGDSGTEFLHPVIHQIPSHDRGHRRHDPYHGEFPFGMPHFGAREFPAGSGLMLRLAHYSSLAEAKSTLDQSWPKREW